MQSEIVVHIVDDDESILRSVRRLLTLAGYRCQCFTSGETFLRQHDPETPGCAIVDLELPGVDGIGIQSILADSKPSRQIIFLTGRGDIPLAVSAMKSGAVDFLTKPIDATILLDAVHRALAKDADRRREAYTQATISKRLSSLTPREREVLEHVVTGRLNKQIACELNLSEKTVKIHRGRMMKKMDVRTVAELVRTVSDGLERS